MTWFRVGGGGSGVPASLKSRMNAVLNKKFGTSIDYPANGWPDDVDLLGLLEEKTASGSIVTFSDGADDVPLKSCEVSLPASLDGYSSVDVVNTGKNLIKPDKYQTAGNTLALGQTDGTSFGTFLKAGTYAISYETTGDSCYIYRREENDVSNTKMGKRLNATFTLESDGNFRFWLYGDGAVSANISNVQLEAGSTATAYEPYVTPTTHTASLGRTIYGGSVDVVKGEGQKTYGYIVFDGSDDEVWYAYTNYEGYSINISTMKVGTRQDGVCNQLTKSSSTAQGQTNAFWLGVNTRCFYVLGVYQSMGDTVEAFKTYLAENPLILVYPLDAETDFTFEPVEINSRLGDNTMWSDGDMSVVYRSSGTVTPIQPTLISKNITENGTYTASDDDVDGFSEVVVNVSSAVSADPIMSLNAFVSKSGVSGTNTSTVARSFTMSAAGKLIFASGTYGFTNTASNDGYFEIQKNGVSVVKQYCSTSTNTPISISEISVEENDVVDLVVGFDNAHSNCSFQFYSAMVVLSEV